MACANRSRSWIKRCIGALDTASEKMLFQFSGLRAKAGRAEGFRTGVLNTHENEIASWLFPNNALQERSFGLLTFLAAEGRNFSIISTATSKRAQGSIASSSFRPPRSRCGTDFSLWGSVSEPRPHAPAKIDGLLA